MAADGTGVTVGKIVVSGETVRPAANGETAKTGVTVAVGITSRIIVGDMKEALPCRRAFLCPTRKPIWTSARDRTKRFFDLSTAIRLSIIRKSLETQFIEPFVSHHPLG